MYKVSILVPVYGVEQYIERCSRSLFEQTYQELEFVFVNDRTRDRSIELLKEVVAAYPERWESVKIIDHEKNNGLAASRNTALDNASGEFVICVDSDDWLAPNAIDVLTKRQMETGADLVSGRRLIHEANGEFVWPEIEYKDKEQLNLQMMRHTWDHFITGRLFRRSVFFNHGLHWRDGFDVAEDRYMMTLFAYYIHGFAFVDSIVYHYERRNVNAMTNAGSKERELRNCTQELGNVLLLEQFFADKERVFQEECARCVKEQLKLSMQAAIANRSRVRYYYLLSEFNCRNKVEIEQRGWASRTKAWVKSRWSYIMSSRWIVKTFRSIKNRMLALCKSS